MDMIVFSMWQLLVVATFVFAAYQEFLASGREDTEPQELWDDGAWAGMLALYAVSLYVATQIVRIPTLPIRSPLTWLVWDYAVVTALFFFSRWWRGLVHALLGRLRVR